MIRKAKVILLFFLIINISSFFIIDFGFEVFAKKKAKEKNEAAKINSSYKKSYLYEKQIEETTKEALKLKSKILLEKTIIHGLDLTIKGRRFAQGEALLIKVFLTGKSNFAKILTFQLKMADLRFNFYPGNSTSSGVYEMESFLPISPFDKKGKTVIALSGNLELADKTVKQIQKKISVIIEDGNFKKSHYKKSLKIGKKFSRKKTKKQQEIIAGQYKRIRAALNSSKIGQRFWSLPFIHPTGGSSITSPFWIQRFYNGRQGSAHGGTDFRGKTGHPIKAINHGTVVFADDTFYAGKLIILDHGDWFFSLYMHQSKILVKQGDRVEKGRIIGKIGQSGLVTGPHLHLAIIINGKKVDPLSILSL